MISRLLRDDGVLSALRGIRDSDDAEDSLARIAWSVIAEPGDGVAGALVRALGAADALRLALEDTAPSPLLRVPRDSEGLSDGRAMREALARWRPRAQIAAVEAAVRNAAQVSATLVLPGDPVWPRGIDDLGDHAPGALWVRGDPKFLVFGPHVSIVGARASTSYGEHVAGEIAGDLAATGAVVVSGGAYGIDGAAHRAALGVGGSTVAFLAGGVDRAYPSGHQQLLARIARDGAVVSELPCGAAPTKWRFLARNRLIAALGDATVVVEAGWRSGSLNTAGHAASLGRPLGAVPGAVTSAASAGCHRLLREYDARCVTSAAEVRELWGGGTGGSGKEEPADRVDPDRIRLCDALSTRTPRTVLELARMSGLSAERVTGLLGILALEGGARQSERGWRATLSRDPGRLR